jgi:hypothetical protein
MSLLQKAKQTQTARQTITHEHIELAHAFIKSEIGITQVNTALGYPKKSMQGYITVCRALRQANQNTAPATHEELEEATEIMKERIKRRSTMTQEETDEELKILHG